MLYPHFTKLDLGVRLRFLSVLILSTFAKSSDGRALSIGTQYLKKANLMRMRLQAPKRTNHIACNLFVNFLSCDLRRTKSCRIFNAVLLPASIPWESWKTKPSCFAKVISSSILCRPRCE